MDVINNEVFGLLKAKGNVSFSNFVICVHTLLYYSSLEHTEISVKESTMKKETQKKVMGTRENELNLPIGFLISLLNDYFDMGGKQSLKERNLS